MAGSSYHAVMLALTQKVTGLTYPALIGTDTAVQFLDSPSAGGFEADNAVFVGLDPDTGTEGASGTQTYAGLGGFVKYETYAIRCAVSCFVGGSSDPNGLLLTTSDAQNSARQNAFAILNTIEAAIVDDKQLLGVANPPLNPAGPAMVLWLDLGDIAYLPSEVTNNGGTVGRQADVTFSVNVHGRLIFS